MANAYAFVLKCMLAAQVKLSSAAVPDEKQTDTIVIGPPFYLELHLGGGLRRLSSFAHLYPCSFMLMKGTCCCHRSFLLMLPGVAGLGFRMALHNTNAQEAWAATCVAAYHSHAVMTCTP